MGTNHSEYSSNGLNRGLGTDTATAMFVNIRHVEMRSASLAASSNHLSTPIQNLLSKQVSRKQFLLILGFSIVSILGFSSIVHFFTGRRPGNHIAQNTSNTASNYGHKIQKS